MFFYCCTNDGRKNKIFEDIVSDVLVKNKNGRVQWSHRRLQFLRFNRYGGIENFFYVARRHQILIEYGTVGGSYRFRLKLWKTCMLKLEHYHLKIHNDEDENRVVRIIKKWRCILIFLPTKTWRVIPSPCATCSCYNQHMLKNQKSKIKKS